LGVQEVTIRDVYQGNGVIHVIDHVVMPNKCLIIKEKAYGKNFPEILSFSNPKVTGLRIFS